MIISGKDLGKQGIIEKVITKENKVVVIGINLAKHHLKPSRKNPHGGIIDKLVPMHVSNVMIVCPRCGRPTRIGYKLTKEKKIRICRKCKESLNTQ